MPNGPGARPAKSQTKPTLDQRKHILEHHLRISIVDERVQLGYAQECGQENCPCPPEITIFMCRRPPCPG